MESIKVAIQSISDNFDRDKAKPQILKGLKKCIKELDPEIDVDVLESLQLEQLWAVVNSNASKVIQDMKGKEKKGKKINEELDEEINQKNKEIFGIGKKRSRVVEKEKDDDDDELPEGMEDYEDEEEDNKNEEENEEGEEIEDNEEGELEMEDNEEGEEIDDNAEEENEEGEDLNDKEEEDIEMEDNEAEDEKEFGKKAKVKKENKDHFFNMEDLNKFADEAEEMDEEIEPKAAPQTIQLASSRRKGKNDEKDSLESEEAEIEAEEDSKEEVKFDEFFDDPNAQKEEEYNVDMENDLFAQISSIEQKMLDKKDWNMKGEVLSSERPKESLLANPMDFEVSIKPPPVLKKEDTQLLENMIKLRITDDLFDDPVRKTKINLNKKSNQDTEINFTRDRKGLSELYEEEYTGTKQSEGKQDEIKAECEQMIEELYSYFDALTNLKFTPQSVKPNEKSMTISNVPAIQIEEIGNFTTDNKSTVKSAKELLDTKMIKQKSRVEMSKEELQRIHNRKKRNIRSRIHKKEQMKKMNAMTNELGSKFEAKIKMKAEKEKKMNKESGNKNDFKSTKVFGKINEMMSKGKDINYDVTVDKKDFKKYKL